MRLAIPHHTTRAAARLRLDERLMELLGQFGDRAEEVSHEWRGDTMHFRGKASGLKVEGTIDVTDSEIILESKLPFFAKPFESRIKQSVELEAEKMFRA